MDDKDIAEQAYKNGYQAGIEFAVDKMAQEITNAFYYEFDEIIPSIMHDKIYNIAQNIKNNSIK